MVVPTDWWCRLIGGGMQVNQIGSVSESIDAVKLSKQNGWGVMTSHRSGETEVLRFTVLLVLCCSLCAVVPQLMCAVCRILTLQTLPSASALDKSRLERRADPSDLPSTTNCSASRQSSATRQSMPAPTSGPPAGWHRRTRCVQFGDCHESVW